MAFNPDLISREDVLDAVELIEKRNIKLQPSTGYDVIINEKRYPPKEIIRFAYRIATDEDAGILYGGEPVNRILRALSFPVERKIKFWKLGCNWERGNPSFFDVIQEQKIVITVSDYSYQVNDIVLITEGFTVYALGKVLTQLKPITLRPDLQLPFESREIPFEDELLYAEVEWYDLTDSQIFLYQLQQGIRQVQKQDIINKVLDIWENRDLNFNKVNFYVKSYQDRPDRSWQYPSMVLVPTSGNDFDYKTCFDLHFYKDMSSRESIGEVKILQRDRKITELPIHFTELSDDYCSLGQTLAYYKLLKADFPSEFMNIGLALRDCVFYPEIKKSFETHEGFQKSLIRSSEAQRAMNETDDLIQRRTIDSISSFLFEFEYMVPNALLPHKIDFSFNNDPDLQNRFFCLVGKNGTGKTQVLAQLAKKLSNSNEAGSFSPERPLFTKIIAVSFSLFDKFELPKTEDISYELISFKDKKGLLNEEEIANKLWRSYRSILKSRVRKTIWLNCMRTSLELDFFKINVDELETLDSKLEFSEKLNSVLSSGQKITFHFITRLIACMDHDSIVIFDEPETHLHPNIAGKLIKALKYILDNFSSFCVLATHSPVIVQEIPSRFIRIIERQDDIPLIRQPAIECFGENLTNINNNIFQVDKETELYKITLEELLTTKNIEEIEAIFNHQLSLNARVFLQTIIKQRNG